MAALRAPTFPGYEGFSLANAIIAIAKDLEPGTITRVNVSCKNRMQGYDDIWKPNTNNAEK